MEENKKNLTENPKEEALPSVSNDTASKVPVDKEESKSDLPESPASPFVPKGDGKDISEDVQKILKSTPLPQRRDSSATGDTKKATPPKKVFVNEEFSIKTPPKGEPDKDKLSEKAKSVIPSMRTLKNVLRLLVVRRFLLQSITRAGPNVLPKLPSTWQVIL